MLSITELIKQRLLKAESLKKTTENEIAGLFSDIDKKQTFTEDQLAELIAFDFCENYRSKETGWGTYFGPQMVWSEDGKGFEYPSLSKVTPAVIDYWKKRAYEAINPILKARYAGLVWEFSERVTGNKKDYRIADVYVNSLLDIASHDLHHFEYDIVQKLRRSVQIAQMINNKKLLQKAKQVIVDYELKVAVDHNPGLWGFSYDLLFHNKSVELTEQEKNKIIDDLESRLIRLTENEDVNLIDPDSAQEAAERLAHYYNIIAENTDQEKKQDIKRVIGQVGKGWVRKLEIIESKFVSLFHLERLYQLFIKYQLNEEADSVIKWIQQISLDPKLKNEFKKVSTQIDIPREMFDDYIEYFFKEDSLDITIQKIVLNFIPKGEDIKEGLKENKNHLSSIFTKSLFHDGRIAGKIGSIDDDPAGNIASQLSMNLDISSIFLNLVLNRLLEVYQVDVDTLIEKYLYNDNFSFFEETRKHIYRKGIQAYIEKDYMVCLHLLIPQIEHYIRTLVMKCGGTVFNYKTSKETRDRSHFVLKTFDDVLRDPVLLEILGDNVVLYLRILFTEQKGWNVRNKICHGLFSENEFSKKIADRIFHVLLLLSTVKMKEES